MNYRNDKHGEPVSILGFGCMRFTKNGRSIDIPKAEREIMAAYKAGVNYFDTAWLHDNGWYDDAATGHPVIELAGMYNGCHFGAADDNDDYSGLDQKELSALWEVILSSYLETSDPEKLADADRTIKAYSLLRQIRVTAADEALSKRTGKSRAEKLKKELFDACDTLVPVP